MSQKSALEKYWRNNGTNECVRTCFEIVVHKYFDTNKIKFLHWTYSHRFHNITIFYFQDVNDMT